MTKKLISCIAALSILMSVTATTVFATETAAGSDFEKTGVLTTAGTYGVSDKESVTIKRMNDLNVISAIFDASLDYTMKDGVIEGYVLVKDDRFTSVSDLKSFISSTCTGEVKEWFLGLCDSSLIEKDGVLYVKDSDSSTYRFHTENGVMISEVTADSFQATACKVDDKFGVGKAYLVLQNGVWRISMFEFGDFNTIPQIRISDLAGEWNETDYDINDHDSNEKPRELFIRIDGSITIIYNDGRSLFGEIMEEQKEISGLTKSQFTIYDENNNYYASFLQPTSLPYNDIYFDDSSHFIRKIDPEPVEKPDNTAVDPGFDPVIAPVVRQMEPGSEGTALAVPSEKNKDELNESITDSAVAAGSGVEVPSEKNKDELNESTIDSDVIADSGVETDLPQTGDGSFSTVYTCVLLLVVLGAYIILWAMIFRKKEDGCR